MDIHDIISNSKYDIFSSKIITNKIEFPIYAHENETLHEHSKKTFHVFEELINEDLLNYFYSFFYENNYLKISLNKFKEIIKDFIYFHDIGKISYSFQLQRLNKNSDGSLNKLGLKQRNILMDLFGTESILDYFEANHSLTSALIFLTYLDDKIDIEDNLLLMLFSYVIFGHHTEIRDFEWFNLSKKSNYTIFFILNLLNDEKISTDEYRRKINRLRKKCYLKFSDKLEEDKSGVISSFYNYCYSLLIISDIIASSQSDNDLVDISLNNNRINPSLLKTMHDTFYNYKINKLTDDEVANLDGINKLRYEMYFESSKSLLTSLDNNDTHIFYLNIPTGGGKTNTSMKLALDILENTCVDRIIYSMPFLSILDQNYDIICSNYGLEDNINIRKICSSNSFIFNNKTDDFISEIIFNDDFLDYPVICTTFVKLFNTLIKNNKKNKYGLASLSNSVIILDEVQSLPLKNWSSLYYIMNEISKDYNIYFILMSATLPEFNLLDKDFKDFKYKKLIVNPEKFYDSKFFKNRNEIKNIPKKLSLSNEEEIEEYIVNIVKLNFDNDFNKGLIVLNTVKSSKLIYEILEKHRNQLNFEIDLLNSTILSSNKKDLIDKINHIENNRRYILISTQSIEAGVDVSFSFVIRDFATLDSIEQIRGRCNRHYELSKIHPDKIGQIYLINLVDKNNKKLYSHIYNEEELSTRIKETKQLLIEDKKIDYKFKDLEKYYMNISLSKNQITNKKHEKLEPNDKYNIERWNQLLYSKFNKKDGIHIIIEDNDQVTLFLSTSLDLKYFNDNEIKYIKEIEKELEYNIIQDDKVIGENVLKYYDNNIKKIYSSNKKKIVKKQFSSILNKFFINTYVDKKLKDEYSKNEFYIKMNKDYYFFEVIPDDLIGDEDNKLYSLKHGLNNNYKNFNK